MKYLPLILVVTAVIVSVASLPTLPNMIPMHWNIVGEIDNWMPKEKAVWFFPGLMAAMWALFQVVPHFDPKKSKYADFEPEWRVMQTALIAFFLYVQVITFHISRTGDSIFPSFFLGLGTLFILLGNYMSKIRQNYFIGIKVPWTLASVDNWNKTHRVGSWCFVLAGVITVIEGYVQWFAPAVIFGSIMAATLIPIVYSAYLSRK